MSDKVINQFAQTAGPVSDGSQIDPFDDVLSGDDSDLPTLERALRMSRGFGLFFVRCNHPQHRRQLIDKLSSDLNREVESDFKIQEIEFNEPIAHLLDELKTRLSQPLPDAVFVYGLENSLPEKSDATLTPLIANLNASRNSFSKVIPLPLVFWISEQALVAIFRGAPDFFSVRSGVYFFAASPENTGDLAASLTAEGVQEIANLIRNEKGDRIASIKRLLSDYTALPQNKRDLNAELELYHQLGLLFGARGEAGSARENYERALEIARKNGDKRYEGVILGNLGNAYSDLGEVRKAIEYYEQALGIAREIGDRRGEGNHLGNLGLAYAALGEVRKAIEYYELSLSVYRRLQDDTGQAKQLWNLSQAWEKYGDRDRAIARAEEALEIYKRLGSDEADEIEKKLTEWRGK